MEAFMMRGKDVEYVGRELLDRVERGLEKFARESRTELDEARLQAYLGLEELDDYWQKKRGDLTKFIEELKASESWTEERIGELRLKWHLGVMDARDVLKDLRERVAQSEKQLDALKSDTKNYLKVLKNDLREISQRLAKH